MSLNQYFFFQSLWVFFFLSKTLQFYFIFMCFLLVYLTSSVTSF